MENFTNNGELRFGVIGDFRGHCTDSGRIAVPEQGRLFSTMSRQFIEGDIPDSTKFADGPDMIHDIMLKLDTTFLHDFPDYNREYLERDGFRDWFHASLLDPGRLAYVVFWEVATDLDAISFEWHHFKGHNEICRNFFHGRCYTLGGDPCEIHQNGAWRFRGFNSRPT